MLGVLKLDATILNHNRFCAFAAASPRPQKGSTCPRCTKPKVVQYTT